MENTEGWNTFSQTGKVSDYLDYVKESSEKSSYSNGTGSREERGQREGTGEGNGAVGSHHW